jgi:hypothetical protein
MMITSHSNREDEVRTTSLMMMKGATKSTQRTIGLQRTVGLHINGDDAIGVVHVVFLVLST